ncbi:MAG: hypothetical protein DWQ36_19790 [Acidobacteria bacterium]|nr:MAG: hypothetical protein DWQ30_17890 [Acidobacteriota bacterium]REK03597.1 MAG: hypothetical protein DWQ36_19790 [Acidobacteriota bacterium]
MKDQLSATLATLCAVVHLVAAGTPATAGVIVVTTQSDSNVADAVCSIREALHAAANDISPYQGCIGAIGDDLILVPSGLYLLVGTLVVQTNGQDVTLAGASIPYPRLNFGLASNLLDVQAGSGAGEVTIQQLQLEGGRTSIRLLDETKLVVEDSALLDATTYGIDVQNTVAALPPAQPHVSLDGVIIDGIAFAGPNQEGVGLRVAAGPGDGQELLIRDSTIVDCEIQGVEIAGDTEVTIEDSMIASNGDQVAGGANGAGIGQIEGDLTVRRTVIEGNQGNIGGIEYDVGFGVLELEDVALIGNQGSSGGGARIFSAFAELDRVVVSDNENAGLGGGLTINEGIVTVRDTLVRRNAARGVNGRGGGVAIAGGEVQLTRVSVVENTAGELGGGIYKFSSDTAYLTNVTLSGNESDLDGAGLYVDVGAVSLDSVTIAANRADADDDGTGEGGGVFVAGGAAVSTTNSVVGDNLRGAARGALTDDCSGVLSSNGYNLVATTVGCTISVTVGDATGVPTGLGPRGWLAGAASLGHVPQPGSAALDTGSPSCPAVDQRGLTRPFDGDGAGGAQCDKGAVESHGDLFFDGFEDGDTSAWSSTSS